MRSYIVHKKQTVGIEFLVAIQMAKVLLISGIPNKCNGQIDYLMRLSCKGDE